MAEFRAFLAAAMTHWASLATGGAIVAFLFLAEKVLLLLKFLKDGFPPLVYLSVLGFFVFVACFFAWRDQFRRAEGSEGRLDVLTRTLPKIVFRECRRSPLWTDGKERIFDVCQLWFANEPDVPSEQSVASQVTARVSFWTSDERTELFWVYGQWTKDMFPDLMRYQGTESTRDIVPNNLCAKLNVALKWPGEREMYAYAAESFEMLDRTGRNPDRKIPPGESRCCVGLYGVRAGVDHWFRVLNPGEGDIRFEFLRSVERSRAIDPRVFETGCPRP